MKYRARGVILDGKPWIKVTQPTDHGEFLVGYFDDVDQITDHGTPISPLDVAIIEDGEAP